MKFIATLKNRQELVSAVELFKVEKIEPEILISAGELFLIALYGGSKQEKSLNVLRYQHFVKSTTKIKFNLSLLPPTKSSAREHILRTYQQVQTWLGNYNDPEEWGWCKSYAGLQPIPTAAAPAPAELLKIISCKCAKGCTGACGCRKAGIKCSVICHCSGEGCANAVTISEILQNDMEDNFDENDENPNQNYDSDEEKDDFNLHSKRARYEY